MPLKANPVPIVLDHLVYCVPDLAEAADRIGRALGVSFAPGGRHQTEGTHNVLLRLGDRAYLELLATDLTNDRVAAPRWMGIDRAELPRLTRVALRTENIVSHASILKSFRPELAHVIAGERQRPDGSLLRWQLTRPLPEPAIEAWPFLIDWSASATHPAEQLPEVGCQLTDLTFTTPAPADLQSFFDRLGFDRSVASGPTPLLTAVISGPAGSVELR